MVVKTYAVIRNSTEVENVIVLDDSLAATWLAGDSTRELVEDTGQSQIYIGGTYDRSKQIRNRFSAPVVTRTREDDLADKLDDDSMTFDELKELLRLRGS